EAGATRLDLGERGVVRIVVGDRDLDPGLRLELLDQLGVRVVAPVEELELAFGEGRAGRAEEQGEGGKVHRHGGLPGSVVFHDFFRVSRKKVVRSTTVRHRSTVEIAFTSPVTWRRIWPRR